MLSINIYNFIEFLEDLSLKNIDFITVKLKFLEDVSKPNVIYFRKHKITELCKELKKCDGDQIIHIYQFIDYKTNNSIEIPSNNILSL